MVNKLRNRKSNRLQNFNYSNNGIYFVTICTYNNNCYLGKIENDFMELNQIGFIVQQTWIDLLEHFDYIELDTFIAMPNHIHSLIHVIHDFNMLQERTFKVKEKDSLSRIIAFFKSEVSKKLKKQFGMINFWQKGYYDHIIRNEIDLQNTRDYIFSNPANWKKDEYAHV